MYKVFLVEDEENIRTRIRENFDWQGHGLVLAGEAADGELALSMIYETEPDILITDIKMPFMNGLELSNLIRKKMPWVKIIIISGYDDFQYAQKAISLGVSEYVLKPVRPSQLSEILNKTVDSLEEEKKSIVKLAEFEKKLQETLILQKEKFLLEIIMYGADPSDLFAKADYFNISLSARYHGVMILKFSSSPSLSVDAQYIELLKLSKLIEQVTENQEDVLTTPKTMNEILFLLSASQEEELVERMLLLANKLKEQCDRMLEGSVRIGRGEVCTRITSLSESYKGAEKALEYSFLFNSREIMAEEDISHIGLMESGVLDIKSDILMSFLKFSRIEDIDGFLDEYLVLLQNSHYRGKFLIRFVYFFILISAGRMVESLSGVPREVIPELDSLDDDLLEMEDVGAFKQKVAVILQEVISFRTSRNFSKYRKPIERAKSYIEDNFTNPNISLQEVADVASFSACRFSTIFKQETGETFSNFLTKTRINKAMEYLKTSSMQSLEISQAVGYNDSHYFSSIFKKVCGVSPTQFREQIG